MPTLPYTMEPATIANAIGAYVTCPAAQYLTTKKVVVTNTTNAPLTMNAYKVPSGGTPGTGNILFSGLTIPASTFNGGCKELYELENQILYPGDSLQFWASAASSLVLNVSGIQQTIS